MSWIDFRIEKPKTDVLALVSNEKGWMFHQRAVYHSSIDVWQFMDPNHREALLLDVTHYIPIPHLRMNN